MKNETLKNKLLNNLEEFGREKIEDGIRDSVYNMYNVILTYDEEMNLIVSEEEYTNNKILYNFKNREYNREFYEIIYKELNKDGDDFDYWFDNECCLDSEIETIYELVENTINEI